MANAIDEAVIYLQGKGIKVSTETKLSTLTTFGIGGIAEIFVSVKEPWECVIVQSVCKKFDLPLHMLGFGSNILASDKGVHGVVMQFDKAFDGVTFDGNFVTVRGNVGISKLICLANSKRLGGIECFSGIPASVLGLVVMNGGAFSVEISSLVKSVELNSSGELKYVQVDSCNFGYRTSRFLNSTDILQSVTLELKSGDLKGFEEATESYIKIRKKTQPIGVKTAGSVFKNPSGLKAWKLIEDIGLRGFRINDVCFSEKHSNFIENLGGGKAEDVVKLMDNARDLVYNKFKIELKSEIQILE